MARPRQTLLTRQRIVEAASALVDAEGLEAVSMQRVAKELGYTTMSLYRYVDSKEDMLVLMRDASMNGDPPPPREQLDPPIDRISDDLAFTRRHLNHGPHPM